MDYFNIETESEEENENLHNSKLDSTKWDWDRPENFNLYYSYNKTSKRSLDTNKKDENPTQKRAKDDDLRIEKLHSNSFNLHGHKSQVNRVNWSKKFLKNRLISCSYDSSVILWNLENLCPKKYEKHSKLVRNVIFSNHESHFISVSYDQTSCVTDLETSQVVKIYNHNDILTSVASHPTNESLILLGSKNEVLQWDIKSDKIVKKYKTKSYIGLIQDIMILNDSEFITSGDVVSKDSAEYSIIVWDLESTAVVSNQIFHEKFVCTNLRKHPFNSIFYAQTHGDYIAEFSSRTPFKMNRHRRFESSGHSTQGYSIGFDLNSSGSLIASGSKDGTVYIYNSSSSKLVKKIEYKEIYKPLALDVKFKSSTEEEVVAVAYSNGLVKIFEI